MKVVKILLALLASIAALLVVAAVLLVWLVDPNDYKPYLSDWVSERTGRSFEVADDLQLSFFPWLAVETGGIRLGSPPGFGEQAFATVERASARVKLLPLLRRQLAIGTISLDGLRLDLARDAEGNGNWRVLPERADVSAADNTTRSATSTDFDLEGVRISGGRVVWRDEANEVRYALDQLRVATGPIKAGARVDIELGFRALHVGSQRALELQTSGQLELGETLRARDLHANFRLFDRQDSEHLRGAIELALLSLAEGRQVEVGALTVTAHLDQTGGERLELGASFSGAEFDAATQAMTIDGFRTVIGGMPAEWQLRGQALLDDPQFVGTVSLAQSPLANLLRTLSIPLPDDVDPDSLGDIRLASGFRGTLADGRVGLDEVDAELLGMHLRGNAVVEGTEKVTARVDIAAFDVNAAVRALLQSWLPADIDAAAFQRLALRGDIDFNLGNGELKLGSFAAEMLGAQLTGDLSLDRAGGIVRGNVASSRFASDNFVRAFRTPLTDTVDARELGTISFATQFIYDLPRDTVQLDPLTLEVFGLTASGALNGSGLSAAPAFSGHADVREFAPRDLLQRFNQEPPQTSDEAALRSARISTDFDITPELGRFDRLVVVLDDSRISGNFRVDDFANPSYRFDLSAEHLDVDRYLPPRADAAEPGERVAGDIELSSEGLNAVKISGQARVGDLKLAGMSFQQVATDLAIGAGKAELTSASAKLYGGEFQGSLEVDSTGELPSMSLSGTAANLALAPLIEALAGDANFSGTGNFDLRLTGRGNTITENLRSAAGDMSFALRDGRIDGFNLGRTLCQAFNAHQGLPAPPKLPESTAYQLIRGSATVSEGIASTGDLLARAAFMDITGRGRLAFVDQRLDYKLESKLTQSLGIPGCESMDRMIGDSFPWTLGGTVTQAEIRPDFSKYLRQRVEDELRDRARERVEDRLKERLRDLL